MELICLPLAILFERWTGDRGKMREKAAKEREENEKREKPERGEIREV